MKAGQTVILADPLTFYKVLKLYSFNHVAVDCEVIGKEVKQPWGRKWLPMLLIKYLFGQGGLL